MADYISQFTGSEIDSRLAKVSQLESGKQDNLVSGTNIKTINGQSVLGGGNLQIQSGDTDAVKYVSQDLTDAQKAQARANIDAASLEDIQDMDFVTATTLPTASASTIGHIYLIGPDSNDNYDRYFTQESGGSYSWVPLGSTQIDLSTYATKEEVSQLQQEVEKIEIGGTNNLWTYGDVNFENYIIIGTEGVKLFDAGAYTLSFRYVGNPVVSLIIYSASGSVLGRNFSAYDGRFSSNFSSDSQIERFFFRSQGNIVSITDIQIETGNIATNYVKPFTAVDIMARLSLVSHSESQQLTDEDKVIALRNIGAFGYMGAVGTSYDDTSLATGLYYVTRFALTNASAFLVVYNYGAFIAQQIYDFLTGRVYARTHNSDGWNNWRELIDKYALGEAAPNLLNNTNVTTTTNGITFTINEDKSVTLSGTSTGAAYIPLPCTLPKGKYILSGMPNNSMWGTWYYLFSRGDNEHFNPNWTNVTYQYYPQGYIFEVLNETETVNAYIRVDSGQTIPQGTTFKPMIQRYPYRSMDYVPFGQLQEYKAVYDLIDCTEFNWSGKKINVIGDSIVEGIAGNWVNHIAAILGLSEARNYGIGGCRLAYYGDGQSVTADDSVVARYASMDNDADIVIVHAGTNDWASQVPLGDAESTDQLEFNGALNIIMSGLRTKYPTALVIFDAIMERVDYDAPTHGGTPMPILTSQYSECIKERCNDHHFLFFDSYKELGLDFTQDYTSGVRATTNDGLHPNIGGAKIIGRKLAAFIKGH